MLAFSIPSEARCLVNDGSTIGDDILAGQHTLLSFPELNDRADVLNHDEILNKSADVQLLHFRNVKRAKLRNTAGAASPRGKR